LLAKALGHQEGNPSAYSRFGRAFEPAEVVHHEWGELTLDLDCTGGIASYTTQTEGYSSGAQSLVPLSRLGASGCSN
jgi:hypothetical protein